MSDAEDSDVSSDPDSDEEEDSDEGSGEGSEDDGEDGDENDEIDGETLAKAVAGVFGAGEAMRLVYTAIMEKMQAGGLPRTTPRLDRTLRPPVTRSGLLRTSRRLSYVGGRKIWFRCLSV